VRSGDELIVLEEKAGWGRIQIPDAFRRTWISAEFVDVDGDEGVVTGNRVNVRMGASGNELVLGQLSAGDKVTVAVFPPFVYLQSVAKAVGVSNVAVGAQDNIAGRGVEGLVHEHVVFGEDRDREVLIRRFDSGGWPGPSV